MAFVKITGEIWHPRPDPSAPTGTHTAWIGTTTIAWADEAHHAAPTRTCQAAIMRISTGQGTGDRLWGATVLGLRWIGDPPAPDVAQAVYDVIRDGGPMVRALSRVIISQVKTEAQPSYRAARAA